MHVLSVIALVVSVFALIASGFSAWYTRQQARATQGALELEKKRELERQRPKVDVRLTTLESDPWVKVEILNKGPHTVDSVKLAILDDDWNVFQFEGDSYTHVIVRDSIDPGHTTIVPMTRPERMQSSQRIKILATYRAAEDEWQELLERSVHPPPVTGEEAADWNFGAGWRDHL